MAQSYTSGTPLTGKKVLRSQSDEINPDAYLYEMEFDIPASVVWALPDYLIETAIIQVENLKDFHVSFIEINPDGRVIVQGKPGHNSPIVILVLAVAAALAGIGLYVSFQKVWEVIPTPREIFGPPLAPAGAGSSGGSSLGLFVLIGAGVWLYWRS